MVDGPLNTPNGVVMRLTINQGVEPRISMLAAIGALTYRANGSPKIYIYIFYEIIKFIIFTKSKTVNNNILKSEVVVIITG